MTNQELLDHCETNVEREGVIVFTDDQLRDMTPENIEAIRSRFGARTLMQLPQHEITFFEWLKEADPAVWNDIWANDERPYLVSLAFLTDFSGSNASTGQFVICDLVSVDNYFFSPNLLLDKESTDFVEAVRERFTQRSSMTPGQLLTLEASVGNVDIWHFAYRYNIDLALAKRAVATLVEDRILLHVTDAEHLAQYFDVG
ncbi:MAG: hypothetical protein JSS89_08645 [Bacteroidetes bacterium]|nr:hypothetical protein [Bacteroidota bacterium]